MPSHPVQPTASDGPSAEVRHSIDEAPKLRKIRVTRLIAGVTGAAVLVAGAAFATVALTRTTPTGASSPAEAVARFIKAVETRDPLALIDSLGPGEVSGFSALVNNVKSKSHAARVSTEGDELKGVDLTLTGIKTSTTKLSKRVANVILTSGDASVRIDRAQLNPLLATLISPNYSAASYSAQTVQSHTDFDLALTAVDDGNGWYVSPLYTIGTAAATHFHNPATYSDSMPTVVTEPTPQAAVQSFLAQIGAGPTGVVQALSHVDAAEQVALRDFSSLWQPSLDRLSRAGGWTIMPSITSSTTLALGHDMTGVVVQSGTASWQRDGESGVATLTGSDCTYSTEGQDEPTSCSPSLAVNDFFIPRNETQAARLVVAAVKVNGGYAISLIGSAAATASTGITSVSPQSLRQSLQNYAQASGR